MFEWRLFVLRCWYYQAVALGVTANRYDIRGAVVRRSRLLNYYCIGVNTLLLIGIPVYYSIGQSYMDAYVHLPLLSILCRLNVRTQALLISQVLAIRPRHDRQFGELVQQLLQLDVRHFRRLPASTTASEPQQRWLAVGKCVTMMLHNLVILAANFDGQRVVTWLEWLLNSYFICIWNFLSLSIFGYFLAMWHIGACYRTINSRLEQLLGEQRRHQHRRLRTWMAVDRQLQRIVRQLTGLFAAHIVTLLLTFFLTSMMCSYMAFLNLKRLRWDSVYFVLPLLFCCCKYANIYLLLTCCSTLLGQQQQMRRIVSEWRESSSRRACDECERACEEFLLWATADKPRISIWGLFDLNDATSFTVLQSIVMQAIITVQFHYVLVHFN